jgi:hypothetical protein
LCLEQSFYRGKAGSQKNKPISCGTWKSLLPAPLMFKSGCVWNLGIEMKLAKLERVIALRKKRRQKDNIYYFYLGKAAGLRWAIKKIESEKRLRQKSKKN